MTFDPVQISATAPPTRFEEFKRLVVNTFILTLACVNSLKKIGIAAMDEAGGKKRVFTACRCNKDVPPGATMTINKRKSKTSGIKRSCSRVHVVATTTENRKEINELNNNSNCGGTTAETTAAAALPASTSSNESVVYLGTFGNSICCSIIDLTSCSPTCLVVKHQKDDHSINKRRISATTTSLNKFQEHHRHHHYHPAPPPLIHHQSGEFHQSFRPLRPKSYTLAEHLKTRNKPASSSGGPVKCRVPPSPKKHDYCNVEPGCLCTVLNKMPLDLSFNVNEDTVLEHVLDTEQRDLVPLFEDLNVSELVVESLITNPFSVKALLEMYRVDITDSFSSWVL